MELLNETEKNLENNQGSNNKKRKLRASKPIILSILLVLSILGNIFLVNKSYGYKTLLSETRYDLKEAKSNYKSKVQDYNELQSSYNSLEDLRDEDYVDYLDLSDKYDSLKKKYKKLKSPTPKESKQTVSSSGSSSTSSTTSNNDSDDSDSSGSYYVHITDTGEKYHSAGCGYLSRSDHTVTISEAKSMGLTPCSRCNP